ncbi:Ig-like domain-containing protein [Enterobacter asburiae]|uniref:Ig-like domain-containing protein n=1 Tax=Enterobacter asburiae TaxID=61645 RepID=UPI0034D2399B
MKKTIASTNNTEPNIAALATLPPLPTDVLLWNDYQFPRAIANDDVSEDNTPTFSGKGEPGMTAVIDLGGGQSVRVPVNAEGNWSWTPAPALADGTYTWSVALEDAAGTHRPSLLALVDRMIIIDDGKIVADGPKQQVLAALNGAPANDSTPAKAATGKQPVEASA